MRHGVLSKAIEWGLRDEDFMTDEGRKMYQHMLDLRRDPRWKGALPGVNVMRELYKEFELCDDPDMTLEAYCVMVRDAKLLLEMQQAMREARDSGDNAVERVAKLQERLQRNILAVGYGMNHDVEFSESMRRTMVKHDLQQSGVDMSVGKWPWAPFNEAANGLLDDDYIVFYGRPKSKKSWVMAAFIADLYLQGKTILVYTKEMTADNIFARIGACLAVTPYHEVRTGRLTKEDRARFQEVIEAAADVRTHQRMICLDAKSSGGGDTIEWLKAKVKKYKPHVVCIDGLYLMSDSRGSKNQKDNFRVQNISRDARQMVLETGVPLIATLQATRSAAAHKGANLDEIAFSDAIGQDVTAAIRVINDDEEESITLVVGGAREYRFSGCKIHGKPATDFSFISCLNQKEIDAIRRRDETSDEKETGTAPPRNPAPRAAPPPQPKLPSDRQLIDQRVARTPAVPKRQMR